MKLKVGALFLIAWVVGVGFTFWSNYKFETTPGKASGFVETAPTGSDLHFAADQFNWITFIHPQCACSKATLENLRQMNNDFKNKNVKFHVVFFAPDQKNENLEKSEYVQAAEQLSHTEIYFDPKLKEFNFYDAETSGQSFLFNAERKLVFKGGITEARGHLGESLSMRRIASLVTGSSSNEKLIESPTFGCGNNLKVQ